MFNAQRKKVGTRRVDRFQCRLDRDRLSSLRLAAGDFDDLRIDGDFEPGQKAHPQKTVDTVTKSGLVIVLNHNRHVLGLQRAKLDRRGSSQLPVGHAIRSMQSNGAPLIDDDRGFLGKSPFESYERCASIEDKNAPSAIDRDR